MRNQLRAVHRRRLAAAAALLAPATLFLTVAFLIPIASVLYNSVGNSSAGALLPHTVVQMEDWDGRSLPPDRVYAALAEDLEAASASNQVAELARMLNYRVSGYRSLLMRTAREFDDARPAAPTRSTFEAIDPRWAQVQYLAALKAASHPLTDFFILAALDLQHSADGGLERTPPERRIYLDYLGRTVWMCLVVTLSCLLMGYPLAYLIASTTGRTMRVLLMLVVLSLWTSILVRTAAWVIILRDDGPINGYLRGLGVTSGPIQLLYNRFSVYVVMIHVLLPFMILPIYSVMKGLPTNLLKAASSLGAGPVAAFLQVYLPLTLPGLSAGVLFTYKAVRLVLGLIGDVANSGEIAPLHNPCDIVAVVPMHLWC
jgi:putative spermidine/putrescine transport system permease protein